MSSSLHKRLMKGSVPPPSGLPPRMPGMPKGGQSGLKSRRKDYTPVQWDSYFDYKMDLDLDGNVFNVYCKGNEGPVVLFLHGGGFSGLTWAPLAKELSSRVQCRILAPDLRAHGETDIKNGNEYQLEPELVAKEVLQILKKCVPEGETSPVVLVGHSMGGALAVHTALNEDCPAVGLVVIDVVEGTALEALSSMQSFLRSRPDRFRSLEHAIEWSVRSGQVRCTESARVSMPGQLKAMSTGDPATKGMKTTEADDGAPVDKMEPVANANQIVEEDEEGGEAEKKVAMPAPAVVPESAATEYTWRTDLAQTEDHWKSWFQGLSQNFLAANASKLLLLAGVDRLDTELTVGQMQGKFQLQVLPQAGHAVHEDVPDKVADVLATFLIRNKFGTELDGYQRSFPAC